MYEIETLKNMVAQASDLTEAARQKSERCRDYYDGHQLTDAQQAEYKRRRMPVIVNNRIQRKVDAMVGIEQGSRTDPRAFARGPEDEQAADIATKALVFVDDLTRFDSKRSQAFENLLIEGYGGVEVVVEQRRGLLEVAINRVRWEEIFYDPASREKDFSDAGYLGIMKWMTLEQALDLYEGHYTGDGELEDVLQATMPGFLRRRVEAVDREAIYHAVDTTATLLVAGLKLDPRLRATDAAITAAARGVLSKMPGVVKRLAPTQEAVEDMIRAELQRRTDDLLGRDRLAEALRQAGVQVPA